MVNPVSSAGSISVSRLSSQGSTVEELARTESQSAERSQTPKSASSETTKVMSPPVREADAVGGKGEAVEISRPVPATQVNIGATSTDRRKPSTDSVADFVAELNERMTQVRKNDTQSLQTERRRQVGPSVDNETAVRERVVEERSIDRFVQRQAEDSSDQERQVTSQLVQRESLDTEHVEVAKRERIEAMQQNVQSSIEMVQIPSRQPSEATRTDTREAAIRERKETVSQNQEKVSLQRMAAQREITQEKSQEVREEAVSQTAESYAQQSADEITGTQVDVSV